MPIATSEPVDIRLTPVTRSPKWIVYAKVCLIAALAAVLYARIAGGLAQDWWTQPSLSHGLLVPPLALYVAWLRRETLFATPAIPDSKGILMVAFGCLLYLLGKLGAEFFLQRISMVVMLAAFTWTFWGRRRLRVLAFPLVLLGAMVPLPAIVYNSMAAPLQLLASDVGANLAGLAGITIYRDGNILHLANLSLGVEEACSGLSSLSALVLGALLLGNLLCSRISSQFLVLVMSVVIAIAINVARVAGTAILADYHAEFAMGFYHMFSGWLVFLVGIAAMFGTAKAVVFFLEKNEVKAR